MTGERTKRKREREKAAQTCENYFKNKVNYCRLWVNVQRTLLFFFETKMDQFSKWAMEVQMVCPEQSLADIRRDLQHTRSVDLTINRIFDGEVRAIL